SATRSAAPDPNRTPYLGLRAAPECPIPTARRAVGTSIAGRHRRGQRANIQLHLKKSTNLNDSPVVVEAEETSDQTRPAWSETIQASEPDAQAHKIDQNAQKFHATKYEIGDLLRHYFLKMRMMLVVAPVSA